MAMYEVTHKTWNDQENDNRIAWVLASLESDVLHAVGMAAEVKLLPYNAEECIPDIDAILPRESARLRAWAFSSDAEYPVYF